jgi:hypothetical protein
MSLSQCMRTTKLYACSDSIHVAPNGLGAPLVRTNDSSLLPRTAAGAVAFPVPCTPTAENFEKTEAFINRLSEGTLRAMGRRRHHVGTD